EIPIPARLRPARSLRQSDDYRRGLGIDRGGGGTKRKHVCWYSKHSSASAEWICADCHCSTGSNSSNGAQQRGSVEAERRPLGRGRQPKQSSRHWRRLSAQPLHV